MKEDLSKIIEKEPKYRREQIERAWFDAKINGYEEITTLPLALRERLNFFPWFTVTLKKLQQSQTGPTQKAVLELSDGELIETVLMGRENKAQKNRDWRYTICVSTQAGCPMGCVFCATGACGFKRNLTAEEIIDQYRFWQKRLPAETPIDNIVLMGQGEPLLNYDNVKRALTIILKNTAIGQSKITLSTVGVPAAMERLLEDDDFPAVRFALSLHSAIDATRKKIIPSHQPDFLKFLVAWSKKYHLKIPSRTHFIGLEYTLLQNLNDDAKHLKALIKLASKLGRVRINLIPYNSNCQNLTGSAPEIIKHWHEALMAAGFTATVRRSDGQDIAAACGQLRNTIK